MTTSPARSTTLQPKRAATSSLARAAALLAIIFNPWIVLLGLGRQLLRWGVISFRAELPFAIGISTATLILAIVALARIRHSRGLLAGAAYVARHRVVRRLARVRS